jgi:hypothetical protein
MKFEMEFYHTTQEAVVKVLRKRYLHDVPENADLPLTFKTPMLFCLDSPSELDARNGLNHKVTVELFLREPYLALRLNLTMRPLYLIFTLFLIILLILSHFVFGHWMWVMLFAFSFLIFFWEYYQKLSQKFERYCENLKKEIMG